MFSQKICFDLISMNEMFEVIAFDAKRKIMLAHQFSPDTLKPYKVFVNPDIRDRTKVTFDECHTFEDEDIAHNFYDAVWLSHDIRVP